MSEIAKHWIDGERTASGTVSESVNPVTGAVVGRRADGGQAETRAVIAGARRAFDAAPSSGTVALRQRVLSEMADRHNAHAEELARWSRERPATRQPKAYSRVHPRPHAAARGLTDAAISAEIPPGQRFIIYAEPAGVVAIIVPGTPRRPAHPVPGSGPVRGKPPRTAANFCKDGSRTVHTEPGAEPFQV